MTYYGMVNQEACMQLLIKCYLAVGEYSKAEQMATDLINNHGLALMTEPFGTNNLVVTRRHGKLRVTSFGISTVPRIKLAASTKSVY